jgi:hypothetical protein
VSRCMRTRIVMEEHYTRCQHSMPFVLSVIQYKVALQTHLLLGNTFITCNNEISGKRLSICSPCDSCMTQQ